MKTIKDAVIELGGKWPVDHNYLFYRNNSYFCAPYNESPTYQDKAICSKSEFESKAKRMGFIGKYRWGVEYPTNGRRPELADDVEIEYKNTFHGDKWVAIARAGQLIYEKNGGSYPVTSFRITDPRYKPVDEIEVSYSSIDGIHAGDKISIEGLERANTSWHERGELPPVDVECEVYIQQRDCWAKVKVLAVDGDYIVWRNGSDNKSYIGTHRDSIRPIRTEREKVIEAAVKIYDDKKCFSAESFASELYSAGMLVLPQKKSDTED